MLKTIFLFIFDFVFSPMKGTYKYLSKGIDDNSAVEALKYLSSTLILNVLFFDKFYPDKFLETGFKNQLAELKTEKFQNIDTDVVAVKLVNIYFDLTKYREYFLLFLCIVIAAIYSSFFRRNFKIHYDDSNKEKRNLPVVVACFSFGTFQVIIPLLVNFILHLIPTISSEKQLIIGVVLAFALSFFQLRYIQHFLSTQDMKKKICTYLFLLVFSLVLALIPSYVFSIFRDLYVACSLIDC